MRKNISLISISFCFLFSLPSFSQTEEQGESTAKNPEELFDTLYTVANIKFDSATAILKNYDNPKSKKVAQNLYNDAIKDYKAALLIKPKSYDAYYKIGLAYSKLEKYKLAVRNFTFAIAMDTSKGDTYRERALAEKERGKFDNAMSDLDSAIIINYEDYLAYYERGLMKESSNNKKAAIKDYTKAIELNKDFSKPYFRRAVLSYTDIKDYLFANHDIMIVVKLDSANNEVYYWLGKIKFNIGDFKAAEKALSQYLENDSLNVDALVTRGAARVTLNNYSGALHDFNLVLLKLDKKNHVAYMNRGLANAGLGKNKEALADLDMAAKLKFDFSPIYINRALVKFKMRDKEGACSDLRKAQSLNNSKADALLSEYCPR